jgi:hypothetical protein
MTSKRIIDRRNSGCLSLVPLVKGCRTGRVKQRPEASIIDEAERFLPVLCNHSGDNEQLLSSLTRPEI